MAGQVLEGKKKAKRGTMRVQVKKWVTLAGPFDVGKVREGRDGSETAVERAG